MGNGTNANPDETFMIAASYCVFKCGKNCFTMRIGPLKLIWVWLLWNDAQVAQYQSFCENRGAVSSWKKPGYDHIPRFSVPECDPAHQRKGIWSPIRRSAACPQEFRLRPIEI